MYDKNMIGERLRQVRGEKTREQFASVTGLSPRYIADIEDGKKVMSGETITKICLYTKVSADYLLFGKEFDTEFFNTPTPVKKCLEQIPPEYFFVVKNLLDNMLTAINMAKRQQNND